MAIYLLCLTTQGGMPLFTLKKGECENLPFSTVASLNGFHMFFKSLDITLHTTYAENGWIYVWRDFNNCITLIACGNCSESSLVQLTEVVYSAISLFISLDEILHPALMERMKKESKNYMPVVDAALEASTSNLLGFTDCLLSSDNAPLLQKLSEFSNQCNSLFCALICSQKVAVATDGFWDLDAIDRQLLLLLLNTSSSLQNDIAIYLPKKSPNVAYRFVSIPVAPNSALTVICGSNPTYRDLHALAQNLFRSETITLLQNVERCSGRCLPEQLEIDPNILSLIILNRKTKKCVFSRNTLPVAKRGSAATSASNSNISVPVTSTNTHVEMLKRFFDQSFDVSNFIENHEIDSEVSIIDQYWSSETHKCYALSDDGKNAIFVLCNASVPTHTMRLMTQYLLTTLLQEKTICW